MKKLMPVLSILMLITLIGYGQDYKKFKVGLGIGYALPSDGTAGLLFYLEPMYRVTDQIAVGLRMEGAAITAAVPAGLTGTLGVNAISSYTINGQYYFSNNKFRPFAGFGIGTYAVAAATSDLSGNVTIGASTSVIGFYPRIGFDMGHFNLSLDYNIIPAQETTINLGALGTTKSTSNSSYIGIRLGVSIGGGTK